MAQKRNMVPLAAACGAPVESESLPIIIFDDEPAVVENNLAVEEPSMATTPLSSPGAAFLADSEEPNLPTSLLDDWTLQLILEDEE